MQAAVAREWSEWLVESDDFGGHMVRHRHWDGQMLAFVYSDHKTPWAECSDCGATLTMADDRREPGSRIGQRPDENTDALRRELDDDAERIAVTDNTESDPDLASARRRRSPGT